MSRHWQTWLMFGACVLIVLAAMAAVSIMALRLDRSEREMRQRAALEESVRLALWRMDSSLGGLLAQEGARPYFAYTPFYPAERAYTRMFAQLQKGEVLVPSPLLTGAPADVLLHFQIHPDGKITSPQAPTGNMRDLAESGYTTGERIEVFVRRLDQFRRAATPEQLHAALATAPATARPLAQAPAPVFAHDSSDVSQYKVSAQEYLARSQTAGRVTSNINAEERVSVQQAGPSADALKPVWVHSMLLLMRAVRVEGKDYVQGCWLDWPQIQTALLADVKDRLPLARLAPVTSVTEAEPTRALASLPVKLLPGEAPSPAKDGRSPIRLSLGVAWVCILLAGSVGAVVLAKAISLSERRAAFVSAVTHELRTPLTTFRMYTELLAGGMVADETKRQQYFDTLRTESERLGRLVENVLSYARLENGRHAASLETVALRDLMARLEPRLSGRAGEAGLRLCIVPEGAWEQTVSVDVSVVEQILFNLMDNACKYAAAVLDKRIEVHAERSGDGAILRVCDHGPGIGEKESRRLFEPFRKSARDAAHSAPGVGLGLALSRRLARDLGGDLRLLPRAGDGACFELTLPGSKTDEGRGRMSN